MLVAQGAYWRATLVRADAVALSLVREGLPAELQELRDLRIELPLARWNLVVRKAFSDRKLLGGILLDHASPKEMLSSAIASDRLYSVLQRIILDATTHLVEQGQLAITVPGREE